MVLKDKDSEERAIEHKDHEYFLGYRAYKEKHGYHFTNDLAEEASKMMENASKDKHSWTVAQVKAAIVGLGKKLPEHVTDGDITYLANMFYADFYPEVFETEAQCIKAAIKMANDPDGYEGMTFCRWKTDLKYKGYKFDFTKFV